MAIAREVVVHLAELASLSLDAEEITTFTRELDAIVAHVSELANVDTDSVVLTTADATTHLRADVEAPGLTHEEALARAPSIADEGFAVPVFVEQS